MFKQFATFLIMVFVFLASNPADARTKKKKKKSRSHKSSKAHKNSRHSRKTHSTHNGTGPDLKTITKDSPYKEEPSNGVTPVENKQVDQQ